MRLAVIFSKLNAPDRPTLLVLPRFWGSYAFSVQARNQNASNSAVFNEIATSLTASCQDSPWASRLSINVPVFFLIRALEVHCLHRKCVRTPKARKNQIILQLTPEIVPSSREWLLRPFFTNRLPSGLKVCRRIFLAMTK